MVAITVILAAVIASFVLGLGDTADEVQPNASFSSDFGDEEVTITLTDGDTLEFEELFLRGNGIADVGEDGNIDDFADDTLEGDWSVGSSATLSNQTDNTFAPGNDVNLVWEESGGDNSATLYTFEAPE